MIRTLTLAAALATAPLAVSATEWELDKAHTAIVFEVSHFGFSNTVGVFRDIEADITFDATNIPATAVSVSVDAASIDTFFAERDEHIRTGDFLDVAAHPEITFTSTSVVQTGDDTADVTGNLTILGETEEVTFAATLNKIGANPFDPSRQVAGFRLTGEIDRTAFGMDYGAPAIGAIIPVTIDLEIGAPADAS
ncbi:YceI family protein [Oceanibium sediminis]|uniref:YceI family protein n=1 Tax=Oceanibium sediminis TaxID=2026339 RepID=UPI000DD2C104|nr:YceI family protein [Oceanibium sediminis]